VAIHKSAEPESLVVRTDFDERSAMLTEEPKTYYVTDHYVNHPVVLVRISKIQVDQVDDLYERPIDSSKTMRDKSSPGAEKRRKVRHFDYAGMQIRVVSELYRSLYTLTLRLHSSTAAVIHTASYNRPASAQSAGASSCIPCEDFSAAYARTGLARSSVEGEGWLR